MAKRISLGQHPAPPHAFSLSPYAFADLFHNLAFFRKGAKQSYMQEEYIFSEIQNIVEQIIHKYRPSKIILFGSAARGEYDKVNDLDFLIIKQDVPLYGIDRMRELDKLIDRNIAADMLVYRPGEFEDRIKLGDPFIKTVLKEGRVLCG